MGEIHLNLRLGLCDLRMVGSYKTDNEVEVGPSERRSRIELYKKTGNFLSDKAKYGDASRAITWRILVSSFIAGSYRCLL